MELAVLVDTTAKLVVLMGKTTVEFLDSAELLDGKEAEQVMHTSLMVEMSQTGYHMEPHMMQTENVSL